MSHLPDILLVEDDDLDVQLFRRRMAKAQLTNRILTASNGLHALQMLQGLCEPQPQPDCVLIVDINMPLMDGIEMLREVRVTSGWSDVPAFMLTTSQLAPDIEDAESLGIEGYVLKDNLEAALMGESGTLRACLLAAQTHGLTAERSR